MADQLRGRAGRQGDPGETRFYLSLEDDLLRLFGGERITNLMEPCNLDEDTPIENKTLSKAIENAQTSVESRNFQYRKRTLEYDDVMNKQREIIYGQRKQVLDGMDVKDIIMNMMNGAIAMAKSFTANAPIAVKYAKACIDRGMQMDIDDGIALENELFAMCFATADQKEGMGAFLEKRKEKHFQNK